MLEQHHEKMVNAMREMHRLLEENKIWPGEPLERTQKGHVLTHDILERLECLKINDEDDEDYFEENTEVLQENMVANQEQEDNPYPTPLTIQSDFNPVEYDVTEQNPSQLFGSGSPSPIDPFQITPPLFNPTERLLCVENPSGVSGIQLGAAATHYPWHGMQSCSSDTLPTWTYGATPSYNYSLPYERGNPCLPVYSNENPRYTPYG